MNEPFVPELSIAGNHEEYGIPNTPLGEAVCSLPLTWGLVEGHVQACIISPLVSYPGFVRLTRREALSYEA